jgi:hypothetical protein
MRRKRIALGTLSVIVVVAGVTALWLCAARRQYALDRQLIAALVKKDNKRTLALLDAGADPNTHYTPTPVPTLPELVKRFLHRSPPLVNASPTAFAIACGERWDNTITTIQWQLSQLGTEDDVSVVRAMLEHGAQVNGADKKGRTPLMAAVYLDRVGKVALLLEKGADVNARRGDGWTALRYAVFWHSDDKFLIRQLLAHRADPYSRDFIGITPLSYAQSMQRSDVVALLDQADVTGRRQP